MSIVPPKNHAKTDKSEILTRTCYLDSHIYVLIGQKKKNNKI